MAVEPSTMIKVERDVFAEVIQSRSPIVFSVATQIENRFKQIESGVEDLVFRSAHSRLAKISLQLGNEFGEQAEDRLLVGIRLTHAELATLAGTSRPTISTTLGDSEDEQLIRRSNGENAILNKTVLQEESVATGSANSH